MVVRVVLLACAAALIALGLARHADHAACQDARVDALSITLGHRPAADAGAVARRIERDCRDVDELVNGAVAFSHVGAVAPADRLAREAVRREPQRRNSWLALRAVRQREGDASGAARALARARELDPVGLGAAGGRGSLNRSSGRSTR
jgi:hypothetical protein